MNIWKIKISLFIILVLPLTAIYSGGFASSFIKDDVVPDSSRCKGYQYFRMKGISIDSCSNISLYNEVYGWLGVPYRYGGRSKAGADCSGFASQIYKNVYNIFVGGSAGDIYKSLKPVDKTQLTEGDLVFFRINRYGISHVGVYLSNNKFIHETSYGGSVVISDLDEPYYKRFYFSAGRFLK